jgi:hypothetical protein
MRHWNNRKYRAGKLSFLHSKEFIRKFFAVSGTHPQKIRYPCAKPKNVKEYGV